MGYNSIGKINQFAIYDNVATWHPAKTAPEAVGLIVRVQNATGEYTLPFRAAFYEGEWLHAETRCPLREVTVVKWREG